MYGNNISNPFAMPNMGYGPIMGGTPVMSGPSMMRNASIMSGPSRVGIGSLLGLGRRSNGLLTGARSFNFAGLLNNASKALGVVNQAIPIVKEVGPMIGNMKSMLKIASVFKDETDTNVRNVSNVDAKNETNGTEDSDIIVNKKENDTSLTSTNINNLSYNNEPNFFL